MNNTIRVVHYGEDYAKVEIITWEGKTKEIEVSLPFAHLIESQIKALIKCAESELVY